MGKVKLYKEIDAFLNGEKNTWHFFFDNRFMGITICDNTGVVVAVNNAHYIVTGKTPDDVLNKNIGDFVKLGFIDQVFTPDILKNKRSILAEQTSTSNGKRFLVQCEPIFDDAGDIKYVVCLLFDVSMEKHLRAILEKAKMDDALIYEKLEEWKNLYEQENAQQVRSLEAKLIYQSKRMGEVMQLINHIADSDAVILITGESGVGKELIAKEIHQKSKRKNAPFIGVNCGAIPEGLLESELFGYEAGAFTNSSPKGKTGLFEAAQDGTLFLDEIGEMSLNLQVKLLRVLQEKRFRKIGSTEDTLSEARIISATNADLEKMVHENKFRKDLFYRLNVIPIYVPSLSERKEDIPLLSWYFLDYYCKKYQKEKRFSFDALKCLMDLHFEGNIRELQNLIERLVLLSPNEIISVEELLPTYSLVSSVSSLEFDSYTSFTNKSYKELMESYERQILVYYNEKYRSTYEIAEKLELNQSTVWRKLQKYNIIPHI